MEQNLPAVFTLVQARALGYTKSQAKYRCQIGQWRKVLGDGWTATAGPIPLEARLVAAALTWPDAVLASRTAAIVHGFPLEDDDLVHVFVPGKRHPRAGLVKRVLELEPEDVMLAGNIAVTTPPRTALDCLSRLPQGEGMQVLAWAVTRGFLDHEAASAFAEHRHGRAGNRQLRGYLRFLRTNAASHAELRCHRMLRRAGITDWAANVPIRDGTQIVACADILFFPERLIVEIDGAAAHTDTSADYRRDLALQLLGYRVVRIPAGMLYRFPRQALALIRGALEAG